MKRAALLLERSPLQIAIALNAVVFAIVYATYTATFLTNDDTSMMLRAAGVSKVSEPSAMILFTHVAIGWCLKTLYSLAGHVPWYAIYLVSCLFVAHTAILYAALWRKPDLRIIGFFILYFLAFGTQILQQLQFTIVASYLSFAGFALLVIEAGPRSESETAEPRRLSWQLVLGIALVVLGCMIRWRAMVMATALFVPFFAMLALRPSLRGALVRLWPIALAILLSGLARESNEAVYQADPGWKSYREFRPKRAEFVDYAALNRLPEEQRLEVLNSVGWSGNDYRIMELRFFMDEELYTVERFQALIDRLPPHNAAEPIPGLKGLSTRITSDSSLRAFALCLLIAIASRWRSATALPLAGAVLAFCGVMGVLVFYFKPPPSRVLLPMLGYLVVAPLLLYEAPLQRRVVRAIAALLCLFWLAAQLPEAQAANAARSQRADAENEFLHAQLELLDPQPTTLYVTWDSRFPAKLVLPFEDISYLDAFQTLGLGTAQRSPAAAEQLATHGIEDLYLALATRDDVLIVSERPDLLELYTEYMKQHYQLRVSSRVTYQKGPLQIFAIESHGPVATNDALDRGVEAPERP